MTPEEQRALAAVLRRLAKYMAERRALITILSDAAQTHRCPEDWESDLARLRETPAYRAILEDFEPMISRLEQDADLSEVLPLIEKVMKGKLPN
jgi:hypothetical protein